MSKFFGSQLKKARQNKGFSQNQLAQKLGLSVSTYANYEQGRRFPDYDDMVNIISVLDLNANLLFKGVDLMNIQGKTKDQVYVSLCRSIDGLHEIKKDIHANFEILIAKLNHALSGEDLDLFYSMIEHVIKARMEIDKALIDLKAIARSRLGNSEEYPIE